jgi:hypothetical protein
MPDIVVRSVVPDIAVRERVPDIVVRDARYSSERGGTRERGARYL